MKVVLTGTTGLIGAEVLTQCLANPSITAVIALTRKPLSTTHPKLTAIVHADFATYPPAVLEQLATADACLWALGLAVPANAAQGVLVNETYTLAGARALKEAVGGRPFRFVYTSGKYVEQDQQARLWFLSENRKLRGRVETQVLGLAGEGFETFVVRPGVVVGKSRGIKEVLAAAVVQVIQTDWLANAMIDVAKEGGEQVREMEELVKRGKELTVT